MILAASLLIAASGAHAFTAKILPVELTRGDPVMVLVTNTTGAPTVMLGKDHLPVSWCGDACWIAIGPVPLNTPPGPQRLSVAGGTLSLSLDLMVRSGEFETQHLTLPEDKVTLSPEDEARTDREAARLRALWAQEGQRLWSGDFITPLEGGISTEFGVNRIMNKKKNSVHTGLDIRGGYGTPVMAANSGRVALSDDLFYGGNTVVIDHGMGIYTVYMHLQESMVTSGQMVVKAQVIGLVGSTGRSTGPHLHYTIKVGAASINPHTMLALPLEPVEELDMEAQRRQAERPVTRIMIQEPVKDRKETSRKKKKKASPGFFGWEG